MFVIGIADPLLDSNLDVFVEIRSHSEFAPGVLFAPTCSKGSYSLLYSKEDGRDQSGPERIAFSPYVCEQGRLPPLDCMTALNRFAARRNGVRAKQLRLVHSG